MTNAQNCLTNKESVAVVKSSFNFGDHPTFKHHNDGEQEEEAVHP
jgi:hypothetical protein